MTKEFLDKIENTNKELVSLNKRLKKIRNKESSVVTDSVQGSGRNYPYIKHNCVIEGIEIQKNKKLKKKYEKMIKHKKYKLDKMKIQLEYELNYIEDSDIKDIIRYKYNDNMTWLQIMFEMKYSSESTAKMKLKRFLEKFNRCDKCDEKT